MLITTNIACLPESTTTTVYRNPTIHMASTVYLLYEPMTFSSPKEGSTRQPLPAAMISQGPNAMLLQNMTCTPVRTLPETSCIWIRPVDQQLVVHMKKKEHNTSVWQQIHVSMDLKAWTQWTIFAYIADATTTCRTPIAWHWQYTH
jgi:acyl-CoA thioesterase